MSKVQVFKLVCDCVGCQSEPFITESMTAPIAEAKQAGWRDFAFGPSEFLFCPNCASINKLIIDQALEAQDKIYQLTRPISKPEEKKTEEK